MERIKFQIGGIKNMLEISTLAEFRQALDQDVEIRIPGKKPSLIHSIFHCVCCQKQNPLEVARFLADELSIVEIESEKIVGFCRHASCAAIEGAIAAMQKKLLPTLRQELSRHRLAALFQKRYESLSEWGRTGKGKEELEAVTNEFCKKMSLAEGHRLIAEFSRLQHALQYRQKKDLVAGEEKINPEHERWLSGALCFWKGTHFPAMPQELSPLEIKKIKACCRYKNFVPDLQHDPLFAREFFEFAFRNILDDTPTAITIGAEFPAIMKRLRSAFIDKRIYRLGAAILRVQEKITLDGPEKDVEIKVKGHFVSLRDERRRIIFSETVTRSLGQIFDSFALKNTITGEFECLQEGIIHFPPKRPPIDLAKKEWWKELAPFETVNRHTLENRYGVVLEPGQGIIAVHASRQYLEGIRFDGSHSWFEAAIPGDDGSYQIIPVGKYPDVEPCPTGAFETLLYSYASWPAYLNYPDRNTFYTHRQQEKVAYIARPEELGRWLEKIRHDLLAVREKSLFFQFQGKNCAGWVQETLDHAFQGKYQGKDIPRYFDVDFADPAVTAPPPLHYLTNFYSFTARNISRRVANTIRVAHGWMLGAWRAYSHPGEKASERVTERLWNNPRWYTGHFTIPSAFFKKNAALLRPLEQKAEK